MSTSWVDSSLFFLFSNSFLKVSYSARHKSHGLFSHGMLPVPFPAKKKEDFGQENVLRGRFLKYQVQGRSLGRSLIYLT